VLKAWLSLSDAEIDALEAQRVLLCEPIEAS
jgi:hypothetical protein